MQSESVYTRLACPFTFIYTIICNTIACPMNKKVSTIDQYFKDTISSMLGRSPIKWREFPDMTIAVDWDVMHQFKQTNTQYRAPLSVQYNKHKCRIWLAVPLL